MQWPQAQETLEALSFDLKIAIRGFSRQMHCYIENQQPEKALAFYDNVTAEIQEAMQNEETSDKTKTRLAAEIQNMQGFRSWALIDAGRAAEAKAQAEKVLANNPNDPAAHIALGRFYLQSEDLEKSLRHYLLAGRTEGYERFYLEWQAATKTSPSS
jgi:tetratricopeptide (TPR) repeat protein